MTLPDTMHALLLTNEGYAQAPDGAELEVMEPYLEFGTIAVPRPEGQQVLIKVAVASINPSDTRFIKGQYGQLRIKGHPAGFEGVGEVVAAGEDQGAQALIGRRVSFAVGLSGWGSWADYAVADARACIPLIDGVSDVDGAAMIVNPLTALAMFDIVREEGQKAFVLTAAASQLCKLMMSVASEEGFRPIAVVRRGDQEAILKEAGAAVVLDASAPDFGQRLAETMKAEQPRIMLDAVTGRLASDIFHLMPKGARWVIYGRLDDDPPTIREPGQMIFMHKRVEGFWLTEWMRSVPPARRLETIAEAQKRFADGRWSTDVTAIVPLSEAMARVPGELAKPNGKVFLKPA